MRIKRKAAAGLCILMLAQTCMPAGAAQSQTAAAKESTKEEAAGTAHSKETVRETETREEEADRAKKAETEEESKRAETKENETRAAGTEVKTAGSSGKSSAGTDADTVASIHQELTLDLETGRIDMEIELKGVEKGNILSVEIPEGYEAKQVSRSIDRADEEALSSGTDWQTEGQQVICQIDSASAGASGTTYRISFGFTDDQWEAYARSREGLERQIAGQARLCDSEGVVLEEADPVEKKLELKPFLEKEAEGQGRAERTFLWTDWMNLGMGAGEGYLVEVIEDLEDGQHFDLEQNQVILVDSDGEEISAIPALEVDPEKKKAFGEIFTVEDAKLLAGESEGAVFYTYQDDDKKQNGILLVPIDSLKERVGVVYRTRVSASEKPDVYQWDVTLRSGSKFLWNRTGDMDEWEEEGETDGEAGADEKQKEDAEEKAETEAKAEAEERTEAEKDSKTPVWQLRAERILADEISDIPEKTAFSSESVWLEASAICSLVEQTAEEDAYDKESGRAAWDFLINQNGENLQEVVITREISGEEQVVTGDLADGEPLEVTLYEGENWDADSGKKAQLPAFEEEAFQKASEEEEGFFGYYVLEQGESGKSDGSLEIHLFQLGQAACEFQVETEIRDAAFAEGSEEFAISSGKTEYTAVLEKQTDGTAESKQAEGSCEAEIPCENIWIDLEAVETAEDSCYDYENHSIAWNMTVNPDQRSLLEPQVTVTLPEGLEQVKLERVVFVDEKGAQQDITEEEWIQVEETAPNKRTKERKAVFSWQAPEEEGETLSARGMYQITFTCQVSDDMRKESFRQEEPQELMISCELEGLAGTEEENRKLRGAEKALSCRWDGAAIDGAGSYQESRYRLDGSDWDGTQMPRVDWCAVVNRNEADLAGTVVRLTWPEGMELEAASVQIYTTKLKADGTEAASRERKLQPELIQQIQAADSWIEFTIPEDIGQETLAITYSSFVTSDMEEADFKGTYQLMRKNTVLEAGELAVEGAKAVSAAEAAKENQIPSVAITVSSTNSDSKLPYLLNGSSYRLVKLAADGTGDSWKDYGEPEEEEEDKGAVEESEEPEEEDEKAAEESEEPEEEDEKAAEESEEPEEEDEEAVEESEEPEEEDEKAAEESEEPEEEDEEAVIIEGRAASNGSAAFLFLETDVLYRLEELEAVPGYEPWESAKYVVILDQKTRNDFPKSDDSHELITGKGQVSVKDTRTPLQWENQDETQEGGQIAFFVQDQDGQPLEGAECSLTYVDYVNPGSRGLRSRTASSDEEGLVVFDGLDAVTENQEGYEIHVTAPSGLEDPAEFSAVVTYLENGAFAADLNGKIVEKKKDGAYITCLPVMVDVQIPVTDQNGNLMKGCGLTLTVEVLTEEDSEEKGEEAYQSYESCPEVSEDGSGYITIPDLPYGTYRLSGSTAVLTLVVDDSGVEAALEAVEKENEREDGASVKLDLTADNRGIYGAAEEDGWYLEEMIPRASVTLTLADAENPQIQIQGGRFLIYETWSNRLVGELKLDDAPEELKEDRKEPADEETQEDKEEPADAETEEDKEEPADAETGENKEEPADADHPETSEEAESMEAPESTEAEDTDDSEAAQSDISGTYRLIPSDLEDAVKENDRGYEYVRKMDGVYRLLPGTYAIWQTESAEGYEPAGDGVWYFTIGEDSAEIGNEDLMAGDGNWKLFENSVIRAQVPVSTLWSGNPEDTVQNKTKTAGDDTVSPDVTLLLKGTSWNAAAGDQEYEQSIICPAGSSAVFEQVPIGIYVIGVSDEQSGKSKKAKQSESLKASEKIQVQVRFDGQVIFRTISGRELEQAELVLKAQ